MAGMVSHALVALPERKDPNCTADLSWDVTLCAKARNTLLAGSISLLTEG